MIPELPHPVTNYLGLLVGGVFLIFLATWVQEGTKLWLRKRNGLNRRKFDDPESLEKSMSMIEKNTETVKQMAEQVGKFTESVDRMSDSLERRANKAILQHETIIDKIDALDIPRR